MKQLPHLVLCALLGLPLAGFAEQITVSDVKVRADDTFGIDPTQDVQALCSVQKGMTADRTEIQASMSNDVKALLSTPNYSNVTVSIEPTDAGAWTVIYTVSRRPQLAAEPAFDGLDGVLREGKARDAVMLASNDRIDDTLASAAAQRLRDKLVSEGYVDARVDYEIRYASAPGYAFLTFLVDPGVERSIRDYLFEGNTAFDGDTLARLFGWRPIYNPISWFTDMPTTDAKLDDARAMVQEHYIGAGYLDAEVSAPKLVQVEGKREGRVDAVFDVSEGPRYKIGTVTVKGATIYGDDALKASAEQALAEAGSDVATAATLEAMRDAVEGYYTSRGYVDTYAGAQMIARADEPVVDLVYTMTEGTQARIRKIEIRGNSITQDKVIRRELVIQPGEMYDSRLVKRSEARIRNLNYFQPESGVTSYLVKTDKADERDLVFNVREKRTLDTSFGLGISTVDSIFVYARATQSNFDLYNPSNFFRGGGQRASAGVEIGSRRQTIDVSWTQPWVLDMPVSLTLNGYRKTRWYDHYDEIRTGGAATLSWKPQPIWTPFGDWQLDRIGVKYTLEQVDYDDPDEGTWYASNGEAFRFTDLDDGINSKLRFFWEEDHRDRSIFTRSGWSSTVYAEVGVGGDAKDYGLGFNVSKWWNVWKEKDHVLLTRFRFDTVEAYSDDVPVFDRFFVGGGRTIRGFEYRDGGPKAYRNRDGSGDHVGIGGQTLWCATVEYTVPLVSVLRFAVFTDIGAAGEDFFDFGDDILWSVGCGLRLDMPGFPIRLDVATPIVNDDDTEEETFTFMIGID